MPGSLFEPVNLFPLIPSLTDVDVHKPSRRKGPHWPTKDQTRVRELLGSLGHTDFSSEPLKKRLAIDNLNLQCLIYSFESWNAIDTFFVFIIVLISHPAGALSQLAYRPHSRTTQPSTKLRLYGSLNFFYLYQFFSFSLSFSPSPLFLWKAGAKSFDSSNGFAAEESKNYGKKTLLWIFISSSHLQEGK